MNPADFAEARNLKRLKYAVCLRNARTEGDGIARHYIGLENVEPWTGKLVQPASNVSEDSLAAESESTSNTFEVGDVLFGKLRPYLAKVWVAEYPGRSTTELLVMQPRHVDAPFLRYVLLNRTFIDAVDASTFGSKMPRADWDFIGNMLIPVPSLPVQRRIARFLDRQTASIDALISAKQRQLALISEKRKAMIASAVTRGLDSAAQMRDSGVSWLGDAPAHWRIERAKYLFVQSSLPTGLGDEIVTCFRDGEVTLRSNRREEGFTNADLEVGYQGVRPGQLVLHSMDAFAGAIGVSDSSGKCSPEYIVCDPIDADIRSDYFGHMLRVMALAGFIQASCPAVRERAPRIRFNNFGEMYLPIPPRGEQIAIVEHITREAARLDRISAAAGRTIALLKERRSALIAAAVTGQLKLD